MLIKGLLAHLERVRQQPWIGLDFPEDRIQSRPAVQVIAMEDTGRTTAIQHVSLQPNAAADEQTIRFLAASAPLERDLALRLPGFHVDVAVPLSAGRAAWDMTLFAASLRGWSARHLAGVPTGASTQVITVAGAPVRLRVEKRACPGELGRLSIVRAELPVTFPAVLSARLQERLGTLLGTSADRHLLLIEKDDALWIASQLRVELENSLDAAELSRLHEVWMVDARASTPDDGPAFRRVLPDDA